MNTIQEINETILLKGKQLAADTKMAIINVAVPSDSYKSVQASTDVPERPWMLSGTACIVTSIIGLMASDSRWPYYLGLVGLASLGVGLSKRNQTQAASGKQTQSNCEIDAAKDVIIEQCNRILDSAKAEWDSFMDSTKIKVQEIIRNSDISENDKDDMLSFTYYPETLSLSTLPLLDRFDAIESNVNLAYCLSSKKSDFADEIASAVVDTAYKQIHTYNRIIF